MIRHLRLLLSANRLQVILCIVLSSFTRLIGGRLRLSLIVVGFKMLSAACGDGGSWSLLLALASEGPNLLARLVLVVEETFVIDATLLGGERQGFALVRGRLTNFYEGLSSLSLGPVDVIVHQVIDERARLPCALVRRSQHVPVETAPRGRTPLASPHQIILLLYVPLYLLRQPLLFLKEHLEFLLVSHDCLLVFSQFTHVVAADRLFDLLSGLLSGAFLRDVGFFTGGRALIA